MYWIAAAIAGICGNPAKIQSNNPLLTCRLDASASAMESSALVAHLRWD